jgi:hypothetical protein
MMLAMLPMAAAMSPAGGAATPEIAMSIAQPIVNVPAVTSDRTNTFMDSAVLALVGSALMGIASIVRRTTRD